MKCIVKGCDNVATKKDFCEDHYDLEKQDAVPAVATGAKRRKNLGHQASMLMHTALLLSGRIAGGLVQGYRGLFQLSDHERAQILDHIASMDIKKGHKKKSLEAFKLAVEAAPEDPATHLKLGKFYMGSGQHDKARECFTKALELDPDSAEIQQALGESYLKAEDYKSALKHLSKAHKAEPKSEKIAYLIGLSHDKLKAYDKAIKFLQDAVNINPRCVEYYYSLGFAQESAGKKDDALQSFKKAVELEKAKNS